MGGSKKDGFNFYSKFSSKSHSFYSLKNHLDPVSGIAIDDEETSTL